MFFILDNLQNAYHLTLKVNHSTSFVIETKTKYIALYFVLKSMHYCLFYINYNLQSTYYRLFFIICLQRVIYYVVIVTL